MRDKLGQIFCPQKSVCKINSANTVTQGEYKMNYQKLYVQDFFLITEAKLRLSGNNFDVDRCKRIK